MPKTAVGLFADASRVDEAVREIEARRFQHNEVRAPGPVKAWLYSLNNMHPERFRLPMRDYLRLQPASCGLTPHGSQPPVGGSSA